MGGPNSSLTKAIVAEKKRRQGGSQQPDGFGAEAKVQRAVE